MLSCKSLYIAMSKVTLKFLLISFNKFHCFNKTSLTWVSLFCNLKIFTFAWLIQYNYQSSRQIFSLCFPCYSSYVRFCKNIAKPRYILFFIPSDRQYTLEQKEIAQWHDVHETVYRSLIWCRTPKYSLDRWFLKCAYENGPQWLGSEL